MKPIIRKETPADYREVEHMIRESFWNVYRPGCLEHFVIHELRGDPAFVKELDLVMELDGRIIGQNMFMHALINADDGREVPIMTMGPICIANDLKRQGSALCTRRRNCQRLPADRDSGCPYPGHSQSRFFHKSRCFLQSTKHRSQVPLPFQDSSPKAACRNPVASDHWQYR